jgi:phosphomethylpyrimidine synthase
MTLIDKLKQGEIPSHLPAIAGREQRDPQVVVDRLLSGRAVIPQNSGRTLPQPVVIGEGFHTKINANIGTSPDHDHLAEELEKIDVAVAAGADAVMDLSTGARIRDTRRRVIAKSPVAVGTVPMYEAAVRARDRYKAFVNMQVDDLFDVIRDHGADGVDFITVHCGATRAVVEMLARQGRVMDMVSRGGSLLVEWMIYNDRENPLYEHYDRLLEIAREFDMTLSLGDGFRPGCLADATDRAQIGELMVLGELTRRAREAGVQVMIEGPGHVPLHQIEENMKIEKSLCEGAPFYVLGPLVTDIAPGYDHITAAIGGALAAMHGADFLCYVTPAEHLRLPTVEDVRQGVIASRIAAHAADIAKGIPGAMEADLAISRARKALDWEGQARHAIDPELVRRMRAERPPRDENLCTMCGEFCAIRASSEAYRLLNIKK